MNVTDAKYEILNKDLNGIEILKRIEKVGRVCYKSEDKITEDGESAKRFVEMLIKNKHEAMLEHGGTISVLFTVDRGITHELVRHRIASFAQESTRYCNYSQEKFGNSVNFISIKGGLELCDHTPEEIEKISKIWEDQMKSAEEAYFKLIDAGVAPQMARSVLPQSTKAEITVTANIREWRHILSLRAAGTTGKPHPQMIEIMYPLLKELHSKVPVLFDDIFNLAVDYLEQ